MGEREGGREGGRERCGLTVTVPNGAKPAEDGTCYRVTTAYSPSSS